MVLPELLLCIAMDDSVYPPVRLQAVSSTSLSTKNVKDRLRKFLEDFQNRSTPSSSGDSTVTAHLQKLSNALQDKIDRGKTLADA